MRLEQLTFTRFLAAIAIVVFHYGQQIFPFNASAISYLFGQANMGVSYFFILSGFVMIIAYWQKDKIAFSNYIKKRFARIYPVYLLAIFALLGYQLFVQEQIDIEGLVLNILLVQSWLPEYALSFNTPGWSLSVEVFFYCSFPFLFNLFYKRYAFKKIIFPTIIFFVICQVALHVILASSYYKGYPSASHGLTFYFPIMHFSEFLIGNIAGIFFIKGLKKRNYDIGIIGLVLIGLVLLKLPTGINYHNGMLAFIFVPFLLLLSANNGLITKFLNWKGIVFLGEISYGIYILQKPVFEWTGLGLKHLGIDNQAIIFYTGVAALVLFSALSYKYFETPLRRRITRSL